MKITSFGICPILPYKKSFNCGKRNNFYKKHYVLSEGYRIARAEELEIQDEQGKYYLDEAKLKDFLSE